MARWLGALVAVGWVSALLRLAQAPGSHRPARQLSRHAPPAISLRPASGRERPPPWPGPSGSQTEGRVHVRCGATSPSRFGLTVAGRCRCLSGTPEQPCYQSPSSIHAPCHWPLACHRAPASFSSGGTGVAQTRVRSVSTSPSLQGPPSAWRQSSLASWEQQAV